jgi:hypothetical protein
MEPIYFVAEAETFDDLMARIFEYRPRYAPYGGVVVDSSFSQVLLRVDAPETKDVVFSALAALGRACPSRPKPKVAEVSSALPVPEVAAFAAFSAFS